MIDAKSIARKIGETEEQVFKTLVTQNEKHEYFVFVIPANSELDFKKAASASGQKSIEMIKGFRHSLCHGWASGPVAFLTEYVLGIHIIGEGCSEIEIKPHLGFLKHVRGSIATPFGKLAVEHIKNTDGDITTKIDAPDGIKIFQ